MVPSRTSIATYHIFKQIWQITPSCTLFFYRKVHTCVFCFNNFIGRDNVNFDTYTMRDHLIKCIESQQFSPFPKTKPTRTKVLSLKNTSVNFSIEKECTARCNLPNLFEDMVCCDRCSAWYHYGCVSRIV
jgi:hypothetical protein